MRKIKKIAVLIMIFTVFLTMVFVRNGISANSDTEIKITFYRNHDENDAVTMTGTYQVGDRIPGVGVAGDDIWLNPDWRQNGRNRLIAWNTQRDGSGTWYRGTHVLGADTPKNLELYQQWVNLEHIISDFGAGFSKMNLETKISGSSDHLTVDTAKLVNSETVVTIGTTLDFSNIKRQMAVLWGRIDRFKDASIDMNFRVDQRLKYKDDLQFVFKSTWMQPDETKLAAKNYLFEKLDATTYKVIIPAELANNSVLNGETVLTIPTKLIPKENFKSLLFDDFMATKSVSLESKDGDKNIMNLITEESLLQILNSPNEADRIIKIKGDLVANIRSNSSNFLLQFLEDIALANLKVTAKVQYIKVVKHSFTNYYFDQEGNEIYPSSTHEVNQFNQVDLNQYKLDLDGFRFDEVQVNKTTTPYTVKYVYTKVAKPNDVGTVLEPKKEIPTEIKKNDGPITDEKPSIGKKPSIDESQLNKDEVVKKPKINITNSKTKKDVDTSDLSWASSLFVFSILGLYLLKSKQ